MGPIDDDGADARSASADSRPGHARGAEDNVAAGGVARRRGPAACDGDDVTADERLAGAKLKAQWAELHIGNAEQVISKFLAPHPYKVGTKHDPQARQWRYYLVKAASPPAALSL